MEVEEIDKEDAILRAEVAQIQCKELELKLQRLIEGAVKCRREIEEMKVLKLYYFQFLVRKCLKFKIYGKHCSRSINLFW